MLKQMLGDIVWGSASSAGADVQVQASFALQCRDWQVPQVAETFQDSLLVMALSKNVKTQQALQMDRPPVRWTLEPTCRMES